MLSIYLSYIKISVISLNLSRYFMLKKLFLNYFIFVPDNYLLPNCTIFNRVDHDGSVKIYIL
jgi:hypothetical protein